jgi:hypothetical protein
MCPGAPNYPTYLKLLVLYLFRLRKLLVEGGPWYCLLLELGGTYSTNYYGIWRGGEL